MAEKELNLCMDEGEYADLENRAAAAGMDLPAYARKVLVDAADDQRRRFLAAGVYFATDWSRQFAERFPASRSDRSHGEAA